MPRQSPYELICNADKTTLTCPGGVVLGYGPGPGLRHANFWNRIGSLFSCYRPAVAVLDVFDANNLHTPVALKTCKTWWEPNLCTATYTTPGLKIEEERTSLKAGLRLKLKLTNTTSKPREWVLFFHGSVEQWAFFDYKPGEPEPQVTCETDPDQGKITLTQPHPHNGLPRPVNSIQQIETGKCFDACGFLQNVSELPTLWQEHGCLANIRLRMGQVGGRFAAENKLPITFSHRHPVYYFAQKVKLAPGTSRNVSLLVHWHTDDKGGKLEDTLEGTTRAYWKRYLEKEVPQLECDDADLVRYWYYVWYVLRANRTAPGRHVKHPFTAPSKYMYWGPWIWDTYFHVLGEMWLSDPQIAQDSIRAVLDMQFPNGFMPVCSGSQYRMCFHDSVPGYEHPGGGGYASYVESKIRNYKECRHPFEAEFEHRKGRGWEKMLHNEKTQTPLITCAAKEFFEQCKDKAFAKEVLGSLKAYDDWMWSRRADREGRFILWHADESGWDNATRHYPVPAKPFDVQIHAMEHRQALLTLAGDNQPTGSDYWQRYIRTYESTRTYWDKNDKWFYDFSASGDGQKTGAQRKQIAASGLFAMWALVHPEIADACASALNHKRVFNTPYPIPTLAKCDPDYAPHGWGWNGPAWLQVNYFTIVGLLGNSRFKEAYRLWEQTKTLIIKNGQPHSYELYDPEIGTGMGCPDYSWQAMVNHLIISYFAGVRGPLLYPSLPPGMNTVRITNLPGAISKVSIQRSQGRIVAGVSFAENNVPKIKAGRLGKVVSVTANGENLVRHQPDFWLTSRDARPQKHWEIIIKCR